VAAQERGRCVAQERFSGIGAGLRVAPFSDVGDMNPAKRERGAAGFVLIRTDCALASKGRLEIFCSGFRVPSIGQAKLFGQSFPGFSWHHFRMVKLRPVFFPLVAARNAFSYPMSVSFRTRASNLWPFIGPRS
jgi:hypothetical protein